MNFVSLITVILELNLIASVLSGKVCLQDRSAILDWGLTSTTIDFSLKLSEKILQKADWIAIGFIYPYVFNISADYSAIFLEDQVVDSFIDYANPYFDTEAGGTDNIINQSYDKKTRTHRWSKPLYTDDVMKLIDISLYQGESLVLYDDYGIYDNGEYIGFGFENIEYIDIVLNDGVYNCDYLINQS